MTLVPVRSTRSEAHADLDEITVARAQAGDRAARTALVRRYQRPVFALLSRMLGQRQRDERQVIEDLAQETFARVLGALPGFDRSRRERLLTWILTIATRLALDHLRAAGRHRDPSEVPGGVPVALPGPEQAADRRALGQALVQAVDSLPPVFRAAFLLRELHGLTYEEIAEGLDVDVGTVRSRLSRARGLLQQMLADMHDE
jgi:RNA polymerase sigma-70 factor (ECF subfamily)